ncbi:MAG: hypothetical protein KC731_34470 [Myxococcales bacterium]|nr:hypothetical protein [Myxococcales bacterium]
MPGAAPAGKPCGALDCQLFDDPREALAVVLAEGPQVLAVGEAHAQRGAEVASSTHRFTEQLLPLLADRASDLVIELMIADGKCGEAEKKTSDAQKPVVEKQAENNQNEFVALGNASKARGVQPHVLRPSCDDYQAVAAAGPDGVPRMLEMIARLTDDLVGRILARNAKENRERMVLAYGGAMHNDVAPREGREPWSFGPSLRERTGGHYVELDIFVPEFIKESDTWRAFPWYPHYDRATMGDRTVLFRTGEGAYTLIFPLTKR